MNNKFKKLLTNKWSDKYLCKLALLDHLKECLEKDNYLKAIDEPKKSAKYDNLNKELMDLKIILDFYFNDNPKLYNNRINKFYNKLEEKQSSNK